jgi:hypothetical protein
MYRHPTHTTCAGCGGAIALDQAELDGEARFVCERCGARSRFDQALARWHQESSVRSGRGRVLAVGLLSFFCLLGAVGFLALLFTICC